MEILICVCVPQLVSIQEKQKTCHVESVPSLLNLKHCFLTVISLGDSLELRLILHNASLKNIRDVILTPPPPPPPPFPTILSKPSLFFYLYIFYFLQGIPCFDIYIFLILKEESLCFVMRNLVSLETPRSVYITWRILLKVIMPRGYDCGRAVSTSYLLFF